LEYRTSASTFIKLDFLFSSLFIAIFPVLREINLVPLKFPEQPTLNLRTGMLGERDWPEIAKFPGKFPGISFIYI
jgi:hypothetical protein